MELKTLAQAMAWLTLDGLAAVWMVKTLLEFADGGQIARSLLIFASSLCG